MKIIELSAWRTPVSNEENLLIDKITSNGGSIRKSKLDEREQVVAKNLVARGVLTRTRQEDKLYYCVDDPEDIWRI